MDLLYKAAESYRRLINKVYTVYFSNGTHVTILFKMSNFLHLSGLHKLKDTYIISNQTYNANRIYKMILSHELTDTDITSSVYYNADSRERLECVCRIAELLNIGEQAVHPFDKSKCQSCVRFKSDTLFFKSDGYDFFITFGVAPDGKADYRYPETLFHRFDNAYIYGQTIVHIDNITVSNMSHK